MLNVLLAAAAIYAGFQFHNQWVAAKARETARLNQKTSPAPPPVLPPMPPQPVLQPSSYIDVAHKDLFDPSRNPDVPIELPPPPPPPRIPPPLPSFYGMMNLGDGYIAIMSKSGSSDQQEVRAGEMIGEFKLVAFNPKEITLEWEGQTIHQRTDEVAPQSRRSTGAATTALPSATNPVNTPAVVMADKGPGADNGMANRPCQIGDTSAPGTVQEGFRKVVRPGPFGNTCYWESMGK